MLGKNMDEKVIAKKLIINSLKLEESLVNLLKAQLKILKRNSNDDIEHSELHKINKTLRYIIYMVTVLDDRIQKGIDILNNNKEKNDSNL